MASDQDIPMIRDIVSKYREQLSAIESIIKHAETIIDQFREKHEQVESSMKVHEGFMSCVRRLPSDVLREIFMHCLPDEKYQIPKPKTAPLLLTRICRSWREVALDTPRLWCSLLVKVTRKDPKRRIAFYRENWLKNARHCPLSLNVYVGSEIREKSWVEMAMDFVRSCTSRCKELNVCFDDAGHLNRLLEDIPILEHLTLSGDLDTLGPTSIIQPNPRLHTLTIDTPSPLDMGVLDIFDPGWVNLTSLAILYLPHDDIDDHVFLTLLQLCPNLEHFAISHVFTHRQNDPISISLTHPKLSVLVIGELFSNGSLLDQLTLPNLRHLLIDNAEDPLTQAVWDDIRIPEQPSLDGSGYRVSNMTYIGYDPELEGYALFEFLNPGWEALTHITLHISNGAYIGLLPLRHCPHLENLVVSFSRIEENHPQCFPFIHHTLRSLKISTRSGCISILLAMLTLSELLHLDLSSERSNWPHAEFKEFLARSDCPLETLKVTARRISIEERDELASLIPTLTHLDLHDLMERPGGALR